MLGAGEAGSSVVEAVEGTAVAAVSAAMVGADAGGGVLKSKGGDSKRRYPWRLYSSGVSSMLIMVMQRQKLEYPKNV
jgi:hypothetical protein